jgi:glycosyltransferase involved in cell wall biosynthesis
MQFSNNKRVIFVHYPHNHIAARLSTMPFALNSICATSKLFSKIDVLTWEKPSLEYEKIFRHQQNVSVHFLRAHSKLSRRFLEILLRRTQIFKFLFPPLPAVCISLGQKALVSSGPLTSLLGIPSIYLNDEFPSCWPRAWASMEKEYAAQAQLLVVPDKCRSEKLVEELSITKESPKVCTIYNAPPIEDLDVDSLSATKYLKTLGLEPNQQFVMNAGSIADWAQAPELMISTKLWPTDLKLLLHSRESGVLQRYRQSLSHLDNDRIIWSPAPTEIETLHGMIKISLATTALYRNTGANIELIGLSSGKVARSIACGTPIICNDLPSLRFIEDMSIGRVVRHPLEIPDAIDYIKENRSRLGVNCLEFAHRNFASESLTGKFCELLATFNEPSKR